MNGELSGQLLLGVDGGGTRCRARLATCAGDILGEGESGPANLRLGFLEAFAAVLDAAGLCLAAAGLPRNALGRTVACLALAGASEPAERAAARRHPLPFRQIIVITDAEAACVGAHGGGDGAVIVMGTGSIGWGIAGGRDYRVGGWGLGVSDEGGGAWLGREAARRVLWAHDGRIAWTPMLREVFEAFGGDPHAIVRWAANARPRDYASFAPLVVEHARRGDLMGGELVRLGGSHLDMLAARLVAAGFARITLTGGLVAAMEPYLAPETRRYLVPAQGDALSGALRIAASAVPERAAAK
jgi:glucosamine kinase